MGDRPNHLPLRDLPSTDERGMPRNVVVVLLDTLNRHLIGPYGDAVSDVTMRHWYQEFETPNFDRFAQRSVRFDKHYAGSLPCIPARHDILCGSLDFLWRPWGSVEVWEDTIAHRLSEAGITSMLVADHPHLFDIGGENYHTDFTAWRYERGHKSDPWRTRPDPSWMGAPETFGRSWTHYDTTRGSIRSEYDFPGAKVMQQAARWIDEEAWAADRWMLFIDEFDPHEPWDNPEPYASMYDDTFGGAWEGPRLIWPPYSEQARHRGVIDEQQERHIRANYGAKLTFIDAWFGRVLDALDRNGLWDSTAVFLVTDHGHYLGEHDIWGKPPVAIREQMGHIPLLIHWPGVEAGTTGALTSSVDIYATIADVFGVEPRHHTHGVSLAPLVTGQVDKVRDVALSGIWAREVHLITDRYKLAKAPSEDSNFPLSMWSNRWSTHRPHGTGPGLSYDFLMPRPNHKAYLDRMPHSEIPVLRQPFEQGDHLPMWALAPFSGDFFWDLQEDPAEEHSELDAPVVGELTDYLREELERADAPGDQLARLGLA